MKIAASMSVGRLAPKHSQNIDNIRVISKNVTPKLIKNDVILIDRLRGQDGKHLTIEEYTDQHFQPVIDQYNMTDAVKDGITVRLVYDGRPARATLDDSKVQEIEKSY